MDWQQLTADCVNFTQRLIQTPSMSFEEDVIADLIGQEMRRLRFDEVWQDGIGNVYGRIHGQERSLGALVLNTHTDHVDPGDRSLWDFDPYSGEIVDGRIYGRGAVDIKGPLATQIYSMAALLRQGVRPRRDVVFTGVVQEEIGGEGAIHWVENLDYPVDLVVLGEPSSNRISLGHRGILSLWLTFYGRSTHASAPHKGENPNYALADFLTKLRPAAQNLGVHDILGPTTVAPTIMEVDTKSGNVTPAWARVMLDFRTAVESHNSIQAFVHQLAGEARHAIHDAWNEGQPISASDDPIFGYYTPPESEVALRAQSALAEGLGYVPELTSYQFATDGRHFVPYNLPMIGFAPGNEFMAHTANENIAIAEIAASLRAQARLLETF
jgi:succinyl-diaminopimelate desuccinylase